VVQANEQGRPVGAKASAARVRAAVGEMVLSALGMYVVVRMRGWL
jgi:hypothetical protein